MPLADSFAHPGDANSSGSSSSAAAAPPPKRARTGVETLQELTQLKALKDQGVLNSPEFRGLKDKILRGESNLTDSGTSWLKFIWDPFKKLTLMTPPHGQLRHNCATSAHRLMDNYATTTHQKTPNTI